MKKVCNVLTWIIIAAMALLAGVLLLPYLFGCKNMAVISGSMEPKVPVGSLVISKQVQPEELKEGDVITYRLNGETMVTHRVVSIDKEKKEVVTKGDANDTEDSAPVAYDRIVGRMAFHVPYVGYVSIYGKTPLGITGICVILAVLLLLNFLPGLFKKEEK